MKKFKFPTAFTILFIVTILTAALTWILPSGKYETLQYDGSANTFIIINPQGESSQIEATQNALDTLGINIELDKFKSGDIKKPIGIPNTYQKLPPNRQGFKAIIQAPLQGVEQGIDIILFVLIIGGFIGIMNSTGVFDSGIFQLSKSLKGREKWLIIIITSIISIGGTTFGLAEETIAFYPILVPIFLAAGYDAMVALGCIYIGSSIGSMASTVNPFASITASNAAGISWIEGLGSRTFVLVIGTIICIIYLVRYAEKVKKDPSLSIIYSQKEEIERTFLHQNINKEIRPFDFRVKLVLSIFSFSFIGMIYGVARLDWWFLEMTTIFFVASILIALIEKIPEEKFVDDFIAGTKDLVGVALIIGIARGVTIIMDNGLISDTLLYYSSQIVQGMHKAIFVNVMMFLFGGLSFFIPSSSGLAVLSMPIMAPLADSVGLSRQIIVQAYQYGMGLMAFITPTGLILASLVMVNVTLDKWFKFIMPLLWILIAFSSLTLVANIYL